MSHDGTGPQKTELPFEVWKALLRQDCELSDNLLAFEALGDSVLQLLWQTGLKPTVRALIDAGAEPTSKSN